MCLTDHLQRKFSDKVDVYSIGYASTFKQLLSFVEDAADLANSLFGQALAQPAIVSQDRCFPLNLKLLMKSIVKRIQGMFVLLAISTTTRFRNAGSFYVNAFRCAGPS